MKKFFYSHIVKTESLEIELGKLSLSEEERKELLELADSHVYHAVLDTLLSELSEDEKKVFLHQIATDQHDTLWSFLREKIHNAEEKVKSTASQVIKELINDISHLKKSSN